MANIWLPDKPVNGKPEYGKCPDERSTKSLSSVSSTLVAPDGKIPLPFSVIENASGKNESTLIVHRFPWFQHANILALR
ncbi:hypothetical protein D3C80_2093930 [compost metagenome]